jgi:hypothetical protein
MPAKTIMEMAISPCDAYEIIFAQMKASGPHGNAPKQLTRAEALKRIEAFVAELDGEWQLDGMEWAVDLLVLLRGFTREARKDEPDRERLDIFQTAMREFIGQRKFLKGVEFVLAWADTVAKGHRE